MKANTRSFVSALSIGFIDNFGLSLVFIVFAPLILNPEYGFFSNHISVGLKNVLLGIAIGSFPLFQFFGAPFWGDVGDRWGRKKALIFTVLGTCFGHLLTALSIYSASFLFLLLSRAIAGFFSGNASICMATVSDISHDAKLKARNFGILTVFWGLGFILAMIIGGYLSDPSLSLLFSPVLPFFVAASLALLGFFIVKILFVETHKPETQIHFDWIKSAHEIKGALQIAQMRPFLFTVLLWSIGWFINFQWFTPVSIERFAITQETISKSLVIFGIFWTLGGVVLNPILVKRFSSHTLAMTTILVVGILVFISSISQSYFLFSFFFIFTSLLSPVSLSNLFTLVSTSAPREVQGKAMGFSQSFQALSGIIVPLGGGAIATWSIKALYPISSLMLILSFFLLLKYRSSRSAQ